MIFLGTVFTIIAFCMSCLLQIFFIIIIKNKIIRLSPLLFILVIFIMNFIYYLCVAYPNNPHYELYTVQQIWASLQRRAYLYPIYAYCVVILGCITGSIAGATINRRSDSIDWLFYTAPAMTKWAMFFCKFYYFIIGKPHKKLMGEILPINRRDAHCASAKPTKI